MPPSHVSTLGRPRIGDQENSIGYIPTICLELQYLIHNLGQQLNLYIITNNSKQQMW